MAEDEVVDQDQDDPTDQAPEQQGIVQSVDGDAYVGPQADDFVGDDRRLRLVSIDPVTGEDRAEVGEVWQDEDGVLHGTGVAAVMLFEPTAAVRYRSASMAIDLSPLTVFYARMARSPFLRAEFVEVSDG